MFRFVARFARVRIEDSRRNRFALNGIQGIALFIVFSSELEKEKSPVKKVAGKKPAWKRPSGEKKPSTQMSGARKRHTNFRRPNVTAHSCLAPNRRCPNGPAPRSYVSSVFKYRILIKSVEPLKASLSIKRECIQYD